MLEVYIFFFLDLFRAPTACLRVRFSFTDKIKAIFSEDTVSFCDLIQPCCSWNIIIKLQSYDITTAWLVGCSDSPGAASIMIFQEGTTPTWWYQIVLTAENKKKQKIPFSFFSFRVLETLMVPHCHSVMADWDLHVTFYTLSFASIPAVRSSAGLHIETHEHSHLPVGANSEWPMNLTRMSLDFRKKPQCLDTQTQWWKHADPAQNRKQPHVSSV